MDLFSREDLRLLVANRQTPCVSMFMPTTRGVRLEDNKRWKNRVREAEERLTAEGMRISEAKELLRPAQELLDNVTFWSNASAGVAAFLAPAMARIYRLPIPLPDQAACPAAERGGAFLCPYPEPKVRPTVPGDIRDDGRGVPGGNCAHEL